MTQNRLSKILAAAGIASRRGSEEVIFAGRVTVNGKKVLLPQTMVDPAIDNIYVDGKRIAAAEEKEIFILNKPLGYLCSNRRLDKSHKLVIDLFETTRLRLFTVGRLDKETSGIILVTNDGDFSNRIIHPSSEIEKEYVVTVNRAISPLDISKLAKGVRIDGIFVKPISIEKVNKDTIRVVIAEGKNREVRRFVEKADLKVKALTRIRIGGLLLPKNLAPGQWREISSKEKAALFR